MQHCSDRGTQARLLHALSRWWGCGLLLLLFLLSLGSPPRIWLDEKPHAELTLHFANHPTWEAISTYEGASKFMAKGPLFFLAGAAWGTAFGMTLPSLRVLSLLFGVLALVASAMLVDEGVGKRRPGAATALVVMPYFLFLSLTYHTDVATVALSLFSVIGYCRNVDRLRAVALCGAVVSTISMLWMRIDSVLLPVAVGLACLLDGPLPRQLTALPAWLSRLPLRLWIGLSLPVLAVLPLLIAWGGILPPSADGRDVPVALQLVPSNLSFGLCVVGLYFAPFALHAIDRRTSTWTVAAAGLLFFMAFPVSFHTNQDDRFLGLIRSAALGASLPDWVEWLMLALFAVSGALALKTILSVRRVEISARALAVFVVVALLAQAVRGPVMYERYLLASNCALFVLALRVGLAPRWTFAWCAGLLVLTGLQLLRFR